MAACSLARAGPFPPLLGVGRGLGTRLRYYILAGTTSGDYQILAV